MWGFSHCWWGNWSQEQLNTLSMPTELGIGWILCSFTVSYCFPWLYGWAEGRHLGWVRLSLIRTEVTLMIMLVWGIVFFASSSLPWPTIMYGPQDPRPVPCPMISVFVPHWLSPAQPWHGNHWLLEVGGISKSDICQVAKIMLLQV